MKNYFDFTLTGKKFLPVWLLFYLIFLIPMGGYYYEKISTSQAGSPSPYILLMLLAIIVVGGLIYFLIAKLTIEHVRYGESDFKFEGRFWPFAGKVLLGLFLTMITIGIYGAWFARDITRFFVDNSYHDGHSFRFNGKGGKLFLIILLVYIIPVILYSFLILPFPPPKPEPLSMVAARQLFVIILAIPYYYFVYRWLIDINYKTYHIHWETEWMPSIGKIALEVFLSGITLGIYLPLAYLKLFAYFSQRTIAKKEDGAYVFGYDIEPTGDFLFIWGQLLLTIVTLGIYYPWAYTKIGKRILSKTYVTALNEY